nr:RecQ family ATP-dependent DNA helicase [Chitinophagaceae bacterium]
VLQREDCLALLPTGGGKSLCFQVPAMAKPGLCLVISPLIALMKDQVENLRRKNITAFAIHSGLTKKEVVSTLTLAGRSNCKFLYVSPERLETNLFREYLHSLGVNLIAVDEAHCISQWGYDFRPSYLKIAALREELPNVPILALTASATEEVQKDICEKLRFRNNKIFRQSFSRPNLSYSAFDVPSRINKVLDILLKVNGTGIVYCRSRKRTKEISDQLNMNNISASYYHAGLTADQRSDRQEAWLKNKTRIIVCTNAFGMGIDKPEVRVVIHADTPDCLENYYQEAGRAGRDGKKSYAVLLYNNKETEELKASPELRFPTLDKIRKIYQALMNHLQIASGTGEGNYYELDINHFIKQFDLSAASVLPALKILEQEELLYFNEQVFVQSKIHITADKEQLSEFEKYNPSHEPLLKSLLRNYEGIMDQPVNIYEKAIAGILRVVPEILSGQLRELQVHGIIEYVPQKEKPQVYLLQNRVKASDLQINIVNYKKRKNQYELRVAAMVNFVEAVLCRSVLIGNYFGDKNITDCGICDVCLDKKRKPLSPDEFDHIHAMLITVLGPAPLAVKEIMLHAGNVSKEKLLQVIRFLQAENKITVKEDGAIGLIK